MHLRDRCASKMLRVTRAGSKRGENQQTMNGHFWTIWPLLDQKKIERDMYFYLHYLARSGGEKKSKWIVQVLLRNGIYLAETPSRTQALLRKFDDSSS